ncbi:MAG: ATP-binding protein [Cystobacterineae bacterium]|nr:ATP-binding protein [Cystobacterineae bacterium]
MLKELVSSEILTAMVREFAILHHIGIRIFDEEGQMLADAKTDNGGFCSAVFATPEGRQVCTHTVSRLTSGPLSPTDGATLLCSSPQVLALSCVMGMRYLFMPILFDGDVLGRLLFGPFLPEQLDNELENESGNELDNELENELENESGNELENENDNELENENDSELENESGSELKNESGSALKNESDSELKNERDNELENENDSELKNESGNKLGNERGNGSDGLHTENKFNPLGPFAEKVRRVSESKVLRILQHFFSTLHLLMASGQRVFFASSMHVETMLEHARELEEQNRKLLRMNQQLLELDRLKSSFLATVSHELRTPLTSIIGYSEMLSEGLAGPMNMEQAEYVATILERSQSLLKLISSMLDITQIEAGKVHLNFEPLSLGEIVRIALAGVRPWLAKKKLTITAHIPAVSDAVGDKERLKQVLINLLTNAIKFTLPQGKISVVLTEKEHQAELNTLGYRLWVEDTGIGIPKDQLDNVFRSFFQVDSSSTREFGGAGLGLAIVKGFVEGHGGLVRVLSDFSKGSRFTVVLPAQPPKEEVDIPLPITLPQVSDRF